MGLFDNAVSLNLEHLIRDWSVTESRMNQHTWLCPVHDGAVPRPCMQLVKVDTLMRTREISEWYAGMLPPNHWHDAHVAVAHDALPEGA